MDEGERWFMNAYDDLSTEKRLGFGVEGRVPWSAIVAYAQWHRLDKVTTQMLIDIVQALDAVYAKWNKEQADKTSGTSKSNK